jgi:uncharacterized protein
LKLVVDINVLVSGSLWTGNPSRLVDALLDGFEEVIQREKFRGRLEQRGRSAREIISRFQASALIVEGPAISAPSTLRDPDDIHVLACAVGARANAIVTGDNDLLSMESFEAIPVLSMREALEKLGIAAA